MKKSFVLYIVIIVTFLSLSSLTYALTVSKIVSFTGSRAAIEVNYSERVAFSFAKLFLRGIEMPFENTYQQLTQYPLCTNGSGGVVGGKRFFQFNVSFNQNGNYTFIINVGACNGVNREDNITINVKFPISQGCSDRVVNASIGEECDDGNLVDGDGCSQWCLREVCGNSRVDTGEVCDATDLSGKTCSSLDYPDGTLKCSRDCKKFDFSGCGGSSGVCGNGILESGEVCDTTSSQWQNGYSCSAYNSSRFKGGKAYCSSCTSIDFSNCQVSDGSSVCGDGVIQPSEQCDGSNWGGIVGCTSLPGFTGGTLRCVGCKFNTSSCSGQSGGKCGDGVVQINETCDGSILKACNDFDKFTGGDLTCSNCQYDTTKCKSPVFKCGDGEINVRNESCDASDLGGFSCKTLPGSAFTGGTLACKSNCQFDTYQCVGQGGGGPKCSNGVIDLGEECDGSNWGAITNCVSFDSAFTGGIIKCDPIKCRFDTSECKGTSGRCSDGQLNIGEECDGKVRKKCADFDSFFGDGLTCTSLCIYNTSACKKASAKCGDGEINKDLGESCDTNVFLANLSKCSDFASFASGSLKCTSGCDVDTSSCVSVGKLNASCLNKIKDANELDVDCGGPCACCSAKQKCSKNNDCCQGFCNNGTCAEATCSDSIKNGFEGDVDCGGDCPSLCKDSKSCSKNSDCESGYCANGVCQKASCTDGVKNGLEADVDCGGSCDEKCIVGQSCEYSADCSSGFCEYNKCSVDKSLDSDQDGMPDWWEEKNQLDSSDPSDANEDPDDDGFTNLEEYLNGTDPRSHDEGAKSHTWNIILIVLGILLMLGGAGFLVYYREIYLPQNRNQISKNQSYQRPTQYMPGSSLKQPGSNETTSYLPRKATKSELLRRLLDKKKQSAGLAQNQKKPVVLPPQKKQPDLKNGDSVKEEPKSDVFSKLKSFSDKSSKRDKKED